MPGCSALDEGDRVATDEELEADLLTCMCGDVLLAEPLDVPDREFGNWHCCKRSARERRQTRE
jgi:hypothetical protein